jgi:hypothetical protein
MRCKSSSGLQKGNISFTKGKTFLFINKMTKSKVMLARPKPSFHPYPKTSIIKQQSKSNKENENSKAVSMPIFAQSGSDLPAYLSKYFTQRYSLFSLYDYGIQLDHGKLTDGYSFFF